MPDPIQRTALKWAKAIESRIPENVLRLYHPEGALWGTLAQEFRLGHKNIYEYFILFLQKENLKCEFKEGQVRVYGDFALYSGWYEFTWEFSGNMVRLPARFSFFYRKEGSNWLIMEHHSSLFPEKPFRVRKYIRKSK
jgi:uncharacterized protein (TIGR02246 family)